MGYNDSTDCSGMYNYTKFASELFGSVNDSVCAGAGMYCDVAWMTYVEFEADANETLNITDEKCVEMAKEDGVARFAIPMGQCFGGRAFGCDENYEFTMNFYDEWECANYDMSNLNKGLYINNSATEVSCVYAWREDGDVCPLPDCYDRDDDGYVVEASCVGSCSASSCYVDADDEEYMLGDDGVTCSFGMFILNWREIIFVWSKI